MDVKLLSSKLGILNSVSVVRKAQELQRFSNVHFNSSSFGVGEVCKSVLCLELACTSLHVAFDREKAVHLTGMSEKAYTRSLANLQNALGLRANLDVRQLAVQFGCVRLISFVQRLLTSFKQRFIAALPESRRGNADFGRPVFTAVAFYLCSKKHKLKIDKTRLIEICGAPDSEFVNVAISMLDLCFDIVGIENEKKGPKSVKQNRDLLDAITTKRRRGEDDVGSELTFGKDNLEAPSLKKLNKLSKASYEEWKNSVLAAHKLHRTISGDPLDLTIEA
eukprot:c1025_g1_i2 orf=466-1299(-)